MKKTILAAAVLCFALNATAGNDEEMKGLTWQAFLGMNVSNIRGDISVNDTYEHMIGVKSKVGLDIGIKADYFLPDAHGVYLSAAVEWTQKGGKQNAYLPDFSKSPDDRDKEFSGSHKINEHYISIPIHVGYKYYFNEDWSMFGEVGPYFAVGICGRNKFTTDDEGSEAKRAEWSYKTFNKNTNNVGSSGGFQRFDCGVGFKVGAEYDDHYSLNVGFDWGLTDMLRGEYRDHYYDTFDNKADKLKNFCISITLGYRF